MRPHVLELQTKVVIAMMPHNILDLTSVKCPLNFVKAKLALEKIAIGDALEIWLDAMGENILSVPKSLTQEGHIVQTIETTVTTIKLKVTRQL